MIILTTGLIGGAFAAFAYNKKTIAFSCVGAWFAFIILFAAVSAFVSRVRKTPPKSANRRSEGVCEICVPCFGVSVFNGINRNGVQYNKTAAYKIIVNLDGRKLTAYSHNLYMNADVLQIAYSDNSGKCYIV